MAEQRTYIAGAVIPDKLNTPVDGRTRININTTDISKINSTILSLGNPFEGQIVYNTATKKYYAVTSVAIDKYANQSITIKELQILDSDERIVEKIEKQILVEVKNNTLKDEVDAYQRNVHYDTSSINVSHISTYATASARGSRADQPKPVTIPVEGQILELWNSPLHTTAHAIGAYDITKTSELEIYNLIPGNRYFYSINGQANKSFTVEFTRRFIKIDGVRNVRDLGGIPTEDGGYIAFDKIFRGSEFTGLTGPNITDEGTKELKRLGIDFDLDLRNGHEITEQTPLLYYKNIPFIRFEEISPLSDSDKSKIKEAFETVADAISKNQKIYIHCQWGFHRAGFLCTLIEGVLGVKQCEIDKDYELSSFSQYDILRRTGSNYRNGINFINTNYNGSWINFLQDCGVDKVLIETFRHAMIVHENIAKTEPSYYQVTYSELLNLRNNSALIPGAKYRMIDFDTEDGREDSFVGCSGIKDLPAFRSAHHHFDLLLTALSENEFDANVKALHSVRDAEGYFANVDLSTWELKYNIDNDRSKFSWAINDDLEWEERVVVSPTNMYKKEVYCDFPVTIADKYYDIHTIYSETDRGFILEQAITEVELKQGDILNIRYLSDSNDFEIYKDSTKLFIVSSDVVSIYTLEDRKEHIDGKGVIYYMKDENNNETPYDSKNVLFEYKVFELDEEKTYYVNTFSRKVNGKYNLDTVAYGNVIKPYFAEGCHYLNNNVILVEDNNCNCNNIFDNNTHDNIITEEAINVKLGSYCANNTITNGDCCILGDNCVNVNIKNATNIKIGDTCYQLNIRNDYKQIVIVDDYVITLDITIPNKPTKISNALDWHIMGYENIANVSDINNIL